MDDYANDGHDEVVDGGEEVELGDGTYLNDGVGEDCCWNSFARRRYRRNCWAFFLSKLSSFCNDDFETRFSLESRRDSRNALIDRDPERSSNGFYRSVSPVPSLAVD